MQIQKERYGKRRPKVTVEDIEDGDVMVLRIASFEEVHGEDDEGKRVSAVLTFQETGDKTYWPNQTSLGILVEVYGNETDSWLGQPVPLQRNSGTFRGKRYENLAITAPAGWADVFQQAGADLPASLRGKKARTTILAKSKGRGKR